MDIYEWADSAINSSPTCAMGLTLLLAAKPYVVPSASQRLYESRLPLIRSFQQTAIDVFKAALRNELYPSVLHWLINETPESFGIRYHRQLEDRHFSLPVFFRTDEAKPGRLIEMSCPGTLWGELQLVFEHAARLGYCAGEESPADRFATQLAAFLNAVPIVHQYVDGATSPAGTRFFMERTRPAVRYWGIDHGLRPGDCNFIRNPLFLSICTEDEFSRRMAKVGQGVTYDLPPNILFDQKASLVLPFWSLTREAFSDDIRDLFPFTTPLLPAGIELPDGSRVTIESFSRRSRSQRAYYLKYAGSDGAMNHGSRAVYRLSNLSSDACLSFLRECLSRYDSGHVWLLQQEETQDDEIVYQTRDGAVHTESLRSKFSGFYGPGGCLGVLAMHGRHYKVHGQADTVVSYVVAEREDDDPA